MTDVDWHCSSRGCKGGTKSFFVLSSRQWPPTCLFGYTFSHSHTPSLSPSFHSSRGKVGILGSPFSNFFSSLPFLSLSFSSSPFLPMGIPLANEETRVALEYRVDGGTRLIEKITMISMTKGADGKIDAGSIFVPAGTVLSGEAGRNARSNARQRGWLRSREFTTGFYSPRYGK